MIATLKHPVIQLIILVIQLILFIFLLRSISTRGKKKTSLPLREKINIREKLNLVKYFQLQTIKRRKKQKRLLTLYKLLKQRKRNEETSLHTSFTFPSNKRKQL